MPELGVRLENLLMSKAASALSPNSKGFSLKGKRITYHVHVEFDPPPPFVRDSWVSGAGVFDITRDDRDSYLIVRSDHDGAILWFREDWIPSVQESDLGGLVIDLRPMSSAPSHEDSLEAENLE